MTEIDRRVHLGNCSVDGGILFLVDPCYIDDSGSEIAADLFNVSTTAPNFGGEGRLGVAFKAGFGDGVYPVYGIYGSVPGIEGDNWIKRVEVLLIDDGHKDESYEDAKKRRASGEGRRPITDQDSSAPALRAQLVRYQHLVMEIQEELWRERMNAEELGETLALTEKYGNPDDQAGYWFGLYRSVLNKLFRTLTYHQEKPWPVESRRQRRERLNRKEEQLEEEKNEA